VLVEANISLNISGTFNKQTKGLLLNQSVCSLQSSFSPLFLQVGTGRGGPRIHFSEGESRSRHFGDLVFLSQGQVVFTVYEVEDAAGVKRLIKAANPRVK
jgi:hypothetical protein